MLKLNRQRKFLFLSVFCLSLLGLLMIYSASCVYALKVHGDGAYFFKKQFLFLLISLGVFFAVLLMDIDWLKKHNKEFYLSTIILLLIVLLVGRKAGGSRRWIYIFGFNFQPSELLKLTFLIYASDYFVRKGIAIKYFKDGLVPFISVSVCTFSLILLQPDLGTVVFWLVWIFFMFFIVGVRKRHLFFLLSFGFIACLVLVLTRNYRFDRLISYFNPWADPRGSGFQLVQSQIAFGHGGLLGVGLGASKQKLLFLPAAHTDFIFSIIGEEFGFLGVSLILSLYFIIFTKIINIANAIKADFFKYICLGIGLIFVLEVTINIGVTCGVFPTKGMTLPFLSYGGTSLLVHYALLGLFFNITRKYELTCKE